MFAKETKQGKKTNTDCTEHRTSQLIFSCPSFRLLACPVV